MPLMGNPWQKHRDSQVERKAMEFEFVMDILLISGKGKQIDEARRAFDKVYGDPGKMAAVIEQYDPRALTPPPTL